MISRSLRRGGVATICLSGLLAVTAHATTPAAAGTYALSLPPGAVTSAQTSTLTAVACAVTNTCVAVGSFRTSTGNVPLLATETAGVWPLSTAISPPGNAAESTGEPPSPVTELLGVSCPAVGDCVAVGTYQMGSTAFAPMVVTESNGVWTPATEVSLPSTALSPPWADLDAVACATVANCDAVGTYLASDGNEEPWSITDVNGVWASPVVPALPSDALSSDQQAALYSIACPSRSWCEAAGTYQSTSGVAAMVLTQSAGAWGSSSTAATVPLPPDAATADDDTTALTALTCPRVRTCVAVGNYSTTSGAVEPMGAIETAGTWEAATSVAVPTLAGATGSLVGEFDGVSCNGATSCTAVGSYGTTAESAPDVAAETSGSWGAATAAAVPSNHSVSGGYGIATGVTCFATAQCLTVGQYPTPHGAEVFASVPATAPSAPRNVTAHFANEKVNVTWSPPSYDGLTAITDYAVVASPGGERCTSTALGCGVSGLTNGHRYSFAVTAINAAGTSASAVVSATPATRPSAPIITSARALAGGVQIVVRAPLLGGGAPITAYEYSLTGAAPWRTPATDPARRILTLTGLLRHHRYVIVVRAVNVAGPGTPSPRVVVTTK